MNDKVDNPEYQPFASPDEARDYVREHWGHIIRDPDGQPTPPDPSDTIPYCARRGPKIKKWKLRAFAEIDDLAREKSLSITTAIERVCSKYKKLRHAHKFDSFESMYNQFKRSDELEKRKAALAAAIFDGDIAEAAEQAFRLSFITDIKNIFRGE